MSAAIEIVGLEKTFQSPRRLLELLRPWRKPKPSHALRGVDLVIEGGELVTLLGPNGAGKTTLLKILSTLVLPTKGSVKILGADVVTDAAQVRRHIGYVLADERSFYWRLSCRENLRFFAALQGMFGQDAHRRIDELCALVGLTEQAEKEFHVLSTGQRQRLAIARGLLADPPVLLFDEATRSLDPGRAERMRRVIRDVVVKRAKKGVLFATHDLEEAKALGDRVVLMKEGRIAAEGPFAAVEAEVRAAFHEEAEAEEEDFRRLFPDLGRVSP